MKGIHRISLALVTGFMLFGAKAALADDCARLGGVVNAVPECVISSAVTRDNSTAPGGPYAIAETLRITGTGVITVPAVAGGNSLTLNITGALLMDPGAKIVGDAAGGTAVGANITINTTGASDDIHLFDGAMITANQVGGSCSGGRSGNITLTSAGGTIHTHIGSVIAAGQQNLPGGSTTGCPAGEIVITTTGGGKVEIGGSVLSQSSMSGVGINQPKGGGPITIIAGCSLLISQTGMVSSRSEDPAADLVHIQGCTVEIFGLVESQAHGHVLPAAGNRCNADNTVAHPLGTRSQFFAACVEVWSGTSITIHNDGAGNNGEVEADVPGPGGNQGRGWVDLFARGDISIRGDSRYAVHSNGGLAQNTDDGGVITVKSSDGEVAAIALAIQANSTSAGGLGGDVVVQASQNIEFGTASIQARGASGGVGAGGRITAQSFQGAINGAAPGELNAFPAASGVVTLTACTGVGGPAATYAGVVTGAETDTVSCPAGNPVLPAGVPLGSCQNTCGLTCTITVNKTLLPSTDPGRFDLQVNGTTHANNVGDGGTTGPQVCIVGVNTFGETGGTIPVTSLADYTTTVTGLGCNDNGNGTGSITIAAGENKTCTIVNARKPRLTVNKVLLPGTDPGLFNLQIDGSTAGTGANVGNNGTTGAVIVTLGAHTVGETAGTGTSLGDYVSVISGDCLPDGSVTVTDGDNKVCTITNSRKPKLTVNKVLSPAADPGLFNLQIDAVTAGTGANVGNNGTTGVQVVTAGQHIVGETAGTGTNLADYASVIGGDCAANGTVTLAAGDNKICTITNTRRPPVVPPPRLTVIKILLPASDPGLFNLQIDAVTAGTGANVGNNGTTGAVQVTAGAHNVGETAGTATSLANYTTEIGGDCLPNGSVTVFDGDDKVCTVTNTRKPRLTVNKVLSPAADPGLFNLQIDNVTAGTGANVGNNGTTGAQVVTVGLHTVRETAGTGTNLVDYASVIGGDCAANGTVTLAPGDTKVCTITNTRRPPVGTPPKLTVIKILQPPNDPGLFNLQIDGVTAGTGANVGDSGTTGAVQVTAGPHTVGETAGTATSLANYTSVIGGDCLPNGSVTVADGDDKTCTITNSRKPTLTVIKTLVPSIDPGKFNLQIDGSTAGTGANVGNTGTTGAVGVAPGVHIVGETAGTGTSLATYASAIGGDCAANGSVTLNAGDNKVCTITNTLRPPVVPPTDIPALDPRLLAALGILLAVAGAWGARRRESVARGRRD